MDPVKVSPPLSGRMARTISLREASVLLLLPLLAWQLAGIVLINQDQTVDPGCTPAMAASSRHCSRNSDGRTIT